MAPDARLKLRYRLAPWLGLVALIIAVAGLTVAVNDPGDSPVPRATRTSVSPRRTVRTLQRQAADTCPLTPQEIRDGTGHQLGDCAPPAQKAIARKLAKRRGARAAPLGDNVDLSNNDPVLNQAAMFRFGIRSEWVKAIEGLGFTDAYAAPMSANGKRAGIVVGGYDFAHVCLVSAVAEGTRFANRLKALQLVTGARVLRWVIDAEYGGNGCNATQWIVTEYKTIYSILHVPGGVYSGNWWLEPHTNCLFAHLPVLGGKRAFSWISGYPNARPPCGRSDKDVHQFTDKGYNGVLSGDMSRLHVSLDELRASAGGPTPRPPTPVPPRAVRLCSQLDAIHWWKAHGGHGKVSPQQHTQAVVIRVALVHLKLGCTAQPHSHPYHLPHRKGALA